MVSDQINLGNGSMSHCRSLNIRHSRQRWFIHRAAIRDCLKKSISFRKEIDRNLNLKFNTMKNTTQN